MLIFILLFFSGNPLATYLFGKFSALVGLVLVLIIVRRRIVIDKDFVSKAKWIIIILSIISFGQYIVLSYVSIQGMLNLIIKILLGAIVFKYLKEDFNWNFFKVNYHLSLISLVFYFLVNILGLDIPFITISEKIHSYILYNFSAEEHLYKNAGMYWEPGAHAGILTLCLALNFSNLKYYWLKHRIKLMIIIAALLLTQSTTGYIVGFIICLFYFVQKRNFFLSVIVLPTFVVIGLLIYQKTEFLKDKIDYQFEKSEDQSIGDFSNTRFGSLLFDWHYIEKHPLIGNGLSEITRYADHQYLFIGEDGNSLGNGNGFSHYLASLGVFFILGYFYLLYRASCVKGVTFSILIFLVVLLNLQGEQWFNYSLYLGLPFMVFKYTIIQGKRQDSEVPKSFSI